MYINLRTKTCSQLLIYRNITISLAAASYN
uniref:Uncharacterized protein n=1 Tax=Arundo donax TaxID=35708 RepID=A0A0A9B5R6_ARUDO